MSIALTIVSWVLLLVVLYAGAVLREKDYGAKQMEWEKQRFNLIAVVFSEARVITSVPDHSKQLTKAGGGNLAMDGTLLNYETLAEVTLLMMDMETERRAATNRLRKALDVVGTWETAHPQPKPPTYFGHRFRG